MAEQDIMTTIYEGLSIKPSPGDSASDLVSAIQSLYDEYKTAYRDEWDTLRICPSARLTTAPDRLDWVHEWVQQSGLMPICPGSQAHLRHEVVGLLTPRLYI